MNVNFNILNQLGSPSLNSNTFANRPAAGQTGRLFISTDTREIYRDTGSGWDLVGTGTGGGISGSGAANQVTYWTGTSAVSGESNLYWDDTNNRLGINNSSPSYSLDVSGNTYINGNIGLGTTLNTWQNSKAIQISRASFMAFNSGGGANVGSNINYQSGDWKYIDSDFATQYYQSAGQHYFNTSQVTGTAGNTVSWIIGMHLNASSNLGVNVSPSSWRTNYQVVELPFGSALYSQSIAQRTGISSNAYLDNSSNWIYSTTNTAQYFEMNAGAFAWYSAASGTIGNTITWTTAMTLNSSGNLGVGVTPSSWLSAYKAIQYGTMGATYTETAATRVGQISNAYVSASSGSWTYITGNSVVRTELEGGNFNIYTSPGGTAGTTATMTRKFYVSNNGIVSLNTTNTSWGSLTKAVHINDRGAYWSSSSSGSTVLSFNVYSDGTNNVRIQNTAGSRYVQGTQTHTWSNFPTGTAGSTITYTDVMTISTSDNLLVGTTTDGGSKFQVSGDSVLTGSGATNATTGLTVRDSATNLLFRVRNDGGVFLGTGQQAAFSSMNTSTLASDKAGSGVLWSMGLNDTGTLFVINGNAGTFASGSMNVFNVIKNFTPASGTATYTNTLLNPTINQTGGANGITRGLYVNPTLTAAADWRSIEISNNSGWGIYQSGASADNYLNGNTLIGTSTDSGFKLDVNGSTRLNGTVRIDGQLAATAGGASGQHLTINCGGTIYKIALLNN